IFTSQPNSSASGLSRGCPSCTSRSTAYPCALFPLRCAGSASFPIGGRLAASMPAWTPRISQLWPATPQRLWRNLGIKAESRAYTPHLTLARIKGPNVLASFLKQVEELGDPEFGSFLADRFILYHSKPGTSGSVYTKLSEFPISK